MKKKHATRITSYICAGTLLLVSFFGPFSYIPKVAAMCSSDLDLTLSGPSSVMIGETFSLPLHIENTSDTGFGPYIDVLLPAGQDGDDGISFLSASYGALSLTTSTYAGGATPVSHPYAVDSGDSPLQIAVATGEQLVVIQLPFGSFTNGQEIDISLSLQLDNYADAGQPLSIYVNGGFQFGCDELDNPASDPSIEGTVYSKDITPTIFTINKTFQEPENETATGPNFPATYRVSVDVASGQTVSPFLITDLLPNNIMFQSVTVSAPATGRTITSMPSTTGAVNPPDNELTISLGAFTGGPGGDDVVFTVDFYVPEYDADGSAVINRTSGDDVIGTNTVFGTGVRTPTDVRDTAGAVSGTGTADAAFKSIAIQKSNTNLDGPTTEPGDTIQFTHAFQISDFFTFSGIVIGDRASDGLRLDGTFTPTLSVTDLSGVTTTTFLSGTSFFYDTSEIGNDTLPGTDGSVLLTFDVSQALIDAGADGIVRGGYAGTGAGIGAVGTITYRMIIQDNFTDTYQSGDPSVDIRDTLSNSVTITGSILNNESFLLTGTEADSSSSNLTVNGSSLSKEVYAINGSTSLSNPIEINPGDIVTYRITYDINSSDVEDLYFVDYLPLPIYDATTITTFDVTSTPAIPVVGSATFGPLDTLHVLMAPTVYTGAPLISTNAGSNTVTFTYGDFDDSSNRTATVDILFSVLVQDDPFGDGLFLTNLAIAHEDNTIQSAAQTDSLVQVQLRQPVLDIQKGVVATSNPADTFSPTTVGPVAFTAPGNSCPRFGSTIHSTNLTTTPINSNVTTMLSTDIVTYALVIENTGGHNGFDVTIKDSPDDDMLIPSGGINICVTRGDGTPLTYTLPGGGAAVPTDLFGSGLQIADTTTGAINEYHALNGENIIVVTYDMEVGTGVYPEETFTNTAQVTRYAGTESGTQFVQSTLSDDAFVTIENVSGTKVIKATDQSSTSGLEVTIGEQVTYQTIFVIPENTVLTGAEFSDILDSGLSFVSIDSITASGTITSSLGSLPALTGGVVYSLANRQADISLGTLSNTDANTGTNETLVVIYTVQVDNSSQTYNGRSRNNRADLIRDTDTGTDFTRVSASNVTIREPQLAIDKTGAFNPNSTGLIYSYIITIDHAGSSTEDAFDIVVVDDLLSYGLSYVSGSYTATGILPGTVTFSGGLEARRSGLNEGESAQIRFDVSFPGWSGELSITNQATVTRTSLSGAISGERTSGGGVNDYTASDDHLMIFNICSVDGYLYLDINDNNLYDTGVDMPQLGVDVTLQTTTGYVLGTGTTNGSGYYLFTGVNCLIDVEVTYDNPGGLVSDSAQNEQTNQQPGGGTVSVPSSDFPGDLMSDNNNFGLLPPEICYQVTATPTTGYNLLDLTSISCQGQGSTGYTIEILDGGTPIYTYTGYTTTVLTSVFAVTTGLADLASGVYSLRCTVGSTTSAACTIPLTTHYCGDATLEGGEVCDDGNSDNTDTCDTGGTTPHTNGTCTLTFCGDGVTQTSNGLGTLGASGTGDEECDDGANGDDTDGCTDSCTLTFCGDTVVQNPNGQGSGGTSDSGDEECDAGTGGNSTCYGTSGLPGGAIACTLTTCGDGVTQAPNGDGFSELCDDGNASDTDACTTSCTLTTCGDGILQSGNGVGTGGTSGSGDEECDDGNGDEFDNCTSTCVIQLCRIDGYVYLDIADNDLYNIGSDSPQQGITVTLDGTTHTLTDATGYYQFTGLDCTSNYTVTYTGISGYFSDSAQLDYSTQQGSPDSILVSSSEFQSAPLYASENDNFGVTRYDLFTDMTLNFTSSAQSGNNYSGTTVRYDITFGNEGPTTAYAISSQFFYTPGELSVTSINLGASLGSLTGVTVMTGAGVVTLTGLDALASGESYMYSVFAESFGGSGDLILATTSVYTDQGTGDMIEASDPDQFTNNIATGSFTIESTCVIAGYAYLDIDGDNEYMTGSDLPSPVSGITISATNASGSMLNVLGGAATTTTNSSGYYQIVLLDCKEDREVTIDTMVIGNLDSSQHERTIQQVSPFDTISVPSASFDEIFSSNQFISPHNNFDVNLYDLTISVSLNQGNGSFASVPTGTEVIITAVFGNQDKGTAANSVVSLFFDTNTLTPDTSSLTLGSLGPVTSTRTPSSLVLSDLPDLGSGDQYTLSFSALITSAAPVGNLVATGTIYVGTPQTDPGENNRFTNNIDTVGYSIYDQSGKKSSPPIAPLPKPQPPTSPNPDPQPTAEPDSEPLPPTPYETPRSETPPIQPQPTPSQEPAQPQTTSEKIEQFMNLIENLPGEHYFEDIPSFLQTGIPLSVGMEKYGVSVVPRQDLQTNPPSRGKPFAGTPDQKYSLEYWLTTVLLPYDPEARGAGIYVLLPDAGYLIPVNEAAETSQAYRSMLQGASIDLRQSIYMQEIFAAGGIHHAGSVRPGQHGKNVIALHSSRYRSQPGRFVEGRYPTIGQLIATLEPGDEVVYFVSRGNEYDRFVYTVETIQNVSPAGMGTLLFPDGGYQAMLYTCTDFGRADKRLVATLSLDKERSDSPEQMGILSVEKIPVEYKNIIDRYFLNLRDGYTYLEAQQKIQQLREYIEQIEQARKGQSLALKQVLRYLKYKIAEMTI